MPIASPQPTPSFQYSSHQDGSQTTLDFSEGASLSQRNESLNAVLELGEHPIDESPKLKVAVIGAGISGITAGILLPIKVPGIQLTILEKNADVVSNSSWAVIEHLADLRPRRSV